MTFKLVNFSNEINEFKSHICCFYISGQCHCKFLYEVHAMICSLIQIIVTS